MSSKEPAMQTIEAIYSGGKFQPLSAVTLPENQRVRLTVEPSPAAAADPETPEPAEPGSFLRKWAGAFQSDVPDAAERHDYYLGQALYEEMTGHKEPPDVR